MRRSRSPHAHPLHNHPHIVIITTMKRLPSLPALDEVQPEMDFSRADLMTPFSLSLAAERAIEHAKLKLDEMDNRLATARSSIEQFKAQRAHRATSDPAPREKVLSHHARIQSTSGTLTREQILHLKTLEMKRLRDDLRSLRSRMNHTRAISETLQTTPPRPPRPLAVQVPDLAQLGKTFDQSMEGRMIKRLSTDSLRHKTSTESLRDAPLIVAKRDNPLSPRPYSSTSIITPMSTSPARRGPHGRLHYSDTLTPPPSASSLEDEERYKSNLPRPRKRISLSMVSTLSNDDQAALLSKIEGALNRLSVSTTNDARRQKLEAALAILEEGDI